MDEFQERYLDHQKRKTETLEKLIDAGKEKKEYTLLEKTALKEIMMNRRSQRIYNNDPLTEEQMEWILKSIQIAPSSCNRQAIYITPAEPKEIEQFLVGGKRWIDKANKVLLLFADKTAYKSPSEIDFKMWNLDAGFVGQNIYLMSEVLGIGSCFVNPNIREENKQAFKDQYGDNYFCGAVALGNYDKKAKQPPLRPLEKVLRYEK